MAGAGYKLFSTGDVLSASDVNLYLQQQTVMVFASAAARTTALASVLAEGMITYLKDTDALEIYSGTAWVGYGSGDITGITTGATSGLAGGVTSGTASLTLATAAKGDLLVGTGSNAAQVLTVGANGTTIVADSSTATGLKWAAASSGALTKITSATFSAVADTGTTFDGVFSTTYNNYLIEMSPITGSVDGADFRFQFRKAGPTTQAASYYGARVNNATATTFSNTASFPITLSFGEASAITMNVYREGTPQSFSYSGFQRSGISSITGGGFNDGLGANTATGFILSASSGTVSGTVAVYGLAD